MKPFASLLLLILLGLQSFYPLVIYSYYYSNKQYIAKVLCENKDKPILQCNGKCFLKKQLKKAQEKEQSEKNSTKAIEPFVFLATSLDEMPVPAPQVIKTTYPGYILLSYSFQFIANAFRPPCA